MISPVFLRGYPSFGPFYAEQLRDTAMFTEVFVISAIVVPNVLKANAQTTKPGCSDKINAPAFCLLLSNDAKFGLLAIQQVAKALKERLTSNRIQLAAAWA
jgi:hypothetical protein